MCVCWFDVFILLFEYISVSVLLSHHVEYWTIQLNLPWEEKQARHDCGVSNLFPPNPPQSSTTHLSIEDQLIDLWPLISSREFNWLTSSMWTAYSVCLSLQTHTQTQLRSVCAILWSIFERFPPPLFFAPLCTAWMIQVIVTKSSRKDFKEISIILLSFLSSKCKKSASVFQLSKPQWHYFYIQMGQKIYLYISIYKYIHANVVGVQ